MRKLSCSNALRRRAAPEDRRLRPSLGSATIGDFPDQTRPAVTMGWFKPVRAINAFDTKCAIGQESVLLRDGPWSRSVALWPHSSWTGGRGARRYNPQIRQPGVLFCGGCGPRRGLQGIAKVSEWVLSIHTRDIPNDESIATMRACMCGVHSFTGGVGMLLNFRQIYNVFPIPLSLCSTSP